MCHFWLSQVVIVVTASDNHPKLVTELLSVGFKIQFPIPIFLNLAERISTSK